MAAKLFTLFVLAVFGLRLSPLFMQKDLILTGGDPVFDDADFGKALTVSSWIKSNVIPTGCTNLWKLSLFGGGEFPSKDFLSLCRDSSGFFKGCYGLNCFTTTCSVQPFTWEFVSLAFEQTLLTMCTTDWASKSLGCVTFAIKYVVYGHLFYHDSSVEVYPSTNSFEAYDFNIEAGVVSSTTFQSRITATACHSICMTCTGPAYNACPEFIPAVELQELWQKLPTNSRVISEGSIAFQGRTYASATEIAVTGWYNLQAWNTAGFIEILRIDGNK